MHLHVPSKSFGLTFRKMPGLLFPLLAQEIEHRHGPVHHSSPQTVGTKIGHRVGTDSIDQEHGSKVLCPSCHKTQLSLFPAGCPQEELPVPCIDKDSCANCVLPSGTMCMCAHTHTNSHTFHMCVCIIHLYIYFTCTNIHIHTDRYICIYSYSCAHIYILTWYTNACTDKHIPT